MIACKKDNSIDQVKSNSQANKKYQTNQVSNMNQKFYLITVLLAISALVVLIVSVQAEASCS